MLHTLIFYLDHKIHGGLSCSFTFILVLLNLFEERLYFGQLILDIYIYREFARREFSEILCSHMWPGIVMANSYLACQVGYPYWWRGRVLACGTIGREFESRQGHPCLKVTHRQENAPSQKRKGNWVPALGQMAQANNGYAVCYNPHIYNESSSIHDMSPHCNI